MEIKTVGLDDEAYERLKAQKREGESFSDTVKRITREVSVNWHRSFGHYAEESKRLSAGLSKRQGQVNEILRDNDESDDGE